MRLQLTERELQQVQPTAHRRVNTEEEHPVLG